MAWGILVCLLPCLYINTFYHIITNVYYFYICEFLVSLYSSPILSYLTYFIQFLLQAYYISSTYRSAGFFQLQYCVNSVMFGVNN